MSTTNGAEMTPNKKRQKVSSATATPNRLFAIQSSIPPTPSTFLSPNGRSRKGSDKVTTFNDNIHGNILLGGVLLSIVDTPQYQRLRNLKQLGNCDFVYLGATHTRFVHSIGVCHLSGKLARTLQANQPYLGITDVDVLCVQIAALCHDLGHGPFSHVFDGVFMKRMSPHDHWRHEDGSVNMFNYLLTVNNVNLQDYGLSAIDKTFIEEIISGTPESRRQGRGSNKHYLYDIVNNTRSGLDMDKLDYFQRDVKNCNVLGTCKFDRFIELAKVFRAQPIVKDANKDPALSFLSNNSSFANTELPFMICYQEKQVTEAVAFFKLRFDMHQLVYTHSTVKKIEFMVTDALVKADPYIKIAGTVNDQHPDGTYLMSQCVKDPMALSNLSDHVLSAIENSTIQAQGIIEAKAILARLRSRKLYASLGRSKYKRDSRTDKMNEDEIKQHLLDISAKLVDEELSGTIPGLVEASLSYLPDDSEYVTNILSQDSYRSEMDVDGPRRNGKGRKNKLKRNASVNSTASVASRISGLDGPIPLEWEDIIVEKMHIHHGQKNQNPVNNMRFFPKDANPQKDIAKQIDESTYESSMSRVYEELAVRVFCRKDEKVAHARKVFERWCDEMRTVQPYPKMSMSQGVLDAVSEVEDEEDDDTLDDVEIEGVDGNKDDSEDDEDEDVEKLFP